ncbi:MAG TPA: hypothetical protein VNW92_27395, partial [Polyangiaceae bacterium]|nr:hypothetical protein [Polyangiaceae bacterium]
GGLAAAASAIFWVTHRPGPAPLITNALTTTTHAAAAPVASETSADPAGVNIDTLPTAGTLAPNAPPLSPAALAAARRAARVEKASLKDDPPAPAKKDSSAAPPPPPPAAPEVAPPPDPPKPAEPAPVLPPPDQRAPLNRGAAVAALSSAASAAMACKRSDGPTGSGTATVTFSPDGPVKSVSVSPPFAGTPVGQCVVNAFRGAHVPPFSGSSFTLPKGFQIPN